MGWAGYTRTGSPLRATRNPAEGCAGDRGIDRHDGPAERYRLCRVRGSPGLVVPPPALCAVRAHRLLRLLAGPACQRARGGHRAPDRPELRAGRGMVLELRGGPHVLKRPGAGPARAPSPRPAGARPGRARAPRLAVSAALTRSSRGQLA